VDEERDLALENGVDSFPDVRLWHHGREVAGFTGGRPRPELDQWVRQQVAVST
jgi:thioredoxin-like negative regulator of GroEL